jgi:hypothetical protein
MVHSPLLSILTEQREAVLENANSEEGSTLT